MFRGVADSKCYLSCRGSEGFSSRQVLDLLHGSGLEGLIEVPWTFPGVGTGRPAGLGVLLEHLSFTKKNQQTQEATYYK